MEQAFKEADDDGNGFISFNEFKHVYEHIIRDWKNETLKIIQ